MLSPDTYEQWRGQGGAALAMREARSTGMPPERWVQELWAHQRIRREQLRTTEGHPVQILHPGFWNREAGPDFLQAVIQLGNGEAVSGDVEIDLHASGWRSHGHAGNAAYHNVILHVVWEPPTQPVTLPTLALRDVLDAPVEELEAHPGGGMDPSYEWLKGRCSAPLARLEPAVLQEVLRQAALIRLRTKASLIRARARSSGWHQALWEAVFRALGYKHNAWPMQRLAEQLPQAQTLPTSDTSPREHWEARLIGLAGLLPREPKAGTYPRRLWDLWWRERESFGKPAIPAALWRLNGVRPANHPQRRLALAAAWVADPTWMERLEAWFLGGTPAEAELALDQLLRQSPAGYWRRHYTLGARESGDSLPLVGAGRLNDLAVNAILPWFWARADAGAEPTARERAEQMYLAWSAGEDNAALKLVRTRLFGDEGVPLKRSAAMQQGLLQVVRDFCSYSNSLCEHCTFPAIVASWPGTNSAGSA